MLINENSKKKTNLILLIAIGFIGLTSLFKIFTFDKHLKEAKSALKDAKQEIKQAQTLTAKVQQELSSVHEKLSKYQRKNQQLQLKIDSIVLAKKAKAPKDWEERQNIIKRQKEISLTLQLLREKDKEFE